MARVIIVRGALAAALLLSGALASAAANIDLADFNDDVM